MVSLVPFRRIRISGRLGVEETSTRLSQSVTRQSLFFPFGKRGFQGRVTAHGFAIHRISSNTNSFLPWTYGTIKQDHGECVIEAIIIWHPIAIALLPLLLIPFLFSGISFDGCVGISLISLPGYVAIMVNYNIEAHELFRFLLATANPP